MGRQGELFQIGGCEGRTTIAEGCRCCLLKPVDQNADASKALFPAIGGDVHQMGLFIKREMLLEGVEHSIGTPVRPEAGHIGSEENVRRGSCDWLVHRP
jgi:hypothetical protein